MIDLQTAWPYVLGAVVLLALVILVLLLLLLRRSARRSELEVPDPGLHEDTPEGAETLEPPPGAPAPLAFRLAFSRAGRKLDRAASGDRHRVPLFLLLGSEGSREPDLLVNAGLELPFGGPAEAGMDLGRGRGFWFLDRGVVLDLAGDMVLAADGRGSDEGSWRTALHLLQKMRPKRPLDGVILTVSCQELIEARGNEALRAALEDRAGRIYRKLWQMQQRLGFRTTVYVLVTGCERLPGFSGLCAAVPPRLRDEMLGWSSPYAADVAYRSAWAEEALTAFGSRMDDLQMEVFAERQTGEPAEADALFLLPASFRSLLELRSLLDQIFKPSAYHESLALRGIWFCGREGQPQPGPSELSETQGTRRTFFVKDLLNEKVFREAALARPTAQTVFARNRAVRVAQALTAASLLLFAGGLLRGRHVLEHDATVLEKFLGQTVVDIRQVRQTRHEDMEDSQLRDAAHELLEGMGRIDFSHFGSVFIPSSWFSPFKGRIELAISRAFEEVILQAIRNELNQEARDRIEEAGVHELSPVLSSGAASGAALLPIEQMPEFLVFQKYVADMKELEKQGRDFNQLGKARDLKPLGELVEYAFEESLPDSFFVDSHLYLAALRRARYEPFDPARFRADASWRAEKLAANFYAALYRRSALAARLEALALGLQVAAVQQPAAGETERFEDLVTRIRDVETVLSGSAQEWAFRREFHLGPDFVNVLAAMQSSQIFDPAAARRIRDAGASGWSAYQRYLASVGSSITGPLLAVRDGKPEMQLSADTLLLQTALKAFLGQGFVASASSGARIQVEVPPGARLAWDPVLLDQAAAATTAYERFREKGLAVLPADLRPAIDAVALDRTRSQTVDLVARAQRFESVPPAVSLSLLENEVRTGIGTFEASVRPVGDLVTALGRVRLEGARRDVTTVMTSEAFRLLRSVDRLLEAEEPYRPRLGGFSWWDGSGPVSPAAWGGSDPAEVGVYLETTRGRIATLASSYSQPLLSWLARAGIAEQPPEVRTLAGKWQNILDDLRDYEAKKPGNPVAVLEDYIANKMPTVETRSCAAAAAPAVLRPARSLFASSLYDISRQLSVRCYALAGTSALALYEETAAYFNQRLAGRYPFSDRTPGPGVGDADPDDVRAFFRLYDRSQAVVRGLPDGGAQGRPLRAARKFLDDMARVRAFFAPFLDAEKPEPLPSFDVEAAFRILREREVGANQIIGWALDVGGDRITDRDVPDPKRAKVRWTVGEPVRLSLRWASDGTRVPVVKPRPGVTVRDRTVTYEYTNAWALLAAVADHRAPLRELPSYAETQPVTLALAVHTQPVEGGPPGDVPTQVFLRLTLLAPGTTQALDPPEFPSHAPMPDDPVVEDVL